MLNWHASSKKKPWSELSRLRVLAGWLAPAESRPGLAKNRRQAVAVMLHGVVELYRTPSTAVDW
jgi:hypothetical protein